MKQLAWRSSQQLEVWSTTLEAGPQPPPDAACPGPHRRKPLVGRPSGGGQSGARCWSSGQACGPENSGSNGAAARSTGFSWPCRCAGCAARGVVASPAAAAATVRENHQPAPGHRRTAWAIWPGQAGAQRRARSRNSFQYPPDAFECWRALPHFLISEAVRGRWAPGLVRTNSGRAPWPKLAGGDLGPSRSGQPAPLRRTMQEQKVDQLWLASAADPATRRRQRPVPTIRGRSGKLEPEPTTTAIPDCTGGAITGWAAFSPLLSAAATRPAGPLCRRKGGLHRSCMVPIA